MTSTRPPASCSVELLIAAGLLALLAVAAFWLLRRALRPLERISEVAAESRRVIWTCASRQRRSAARSDGSSSAQRDARATRGRIRSSRSSEAQLRRFVSSASHELRTPLTSIRGYAALLRRGQHNPEIWKVDLTDRIRGDADGGLIDDLLLLARLDEQRPLARSRTDLAVIAHEAADDARARDRGGRSLSDARPVVVIGDEPRLRQVVANLLENAAVHTPAEAPVRIEVGVRDQMAVLAVIDTGPHRSEQAGMF